MVFADVGEVHRAYRTGIMLQRKAIIEHVSDERWAAGMHAVDTAVGRALLNEIVPKQLPFGLINRAMDKSPFRV
jgi:DNA-directed RNA polymerase subunit beta'